MRPTLITVLRKSRAALWAALISLALLQVAVAGHSTQHLLDDLDETCEFCLKFDQTKTSFADSGSDAPLPCARAFSAVPAEAERSLAVDGYKRIRAPPFA